MLVIRIFFMQNIFMGYKILYYIQILYYFIYYFYVSTYYYIIIIIIINNYYSIVGWPSVKHPYVNILLLTNSCHILVFSAVIHAYS